MIVNHTTGQPISLRALLAQFPSICAADNPGIGSPDFIARGIRGPWSSPPTDAELRTVNHSILAETAPVQHATKTRELIDDVWTEVWTPIPDETLRAQIVADINAEVSAHIDASVPPRMREAMTAEFSVLQYLGPDLWTPEQAARVTELLGIWQWVQNVQASGREEIARVAQMDRPALLAWTMPALPGWGE
jgi:hypothetical protein